MHYKTNNLFKSYETCPKYFHWTLVSYDVFSKPEDNGFKAIELSGVFDKYLIIYIS